MIEDEVRMKRKQLHALTYSEISPDPHQNLEHALQNMPDKEWAL
jgi:hypothetical protein